ncbi:Hsp33 family molecular chaperone HslO [Paralimibaculum aggregatum]|uniref:Hsp33 family molecular chaperone HslO n=1 Tax=Paralimibaculum aggregatum TaxID=3036245 RepID=A0ABQ6LHH1_9RHOB|nr:Hsp33 family molecular chaperone HslO [Limibaculum sp. NKW23]GMG81881.1 Hsp33 family molecular chaperone HslO [Limibaculum sp. NKW23]
MTDPVAEAPRGDDSLIPFQLERPQIRGRFLRLDRTLQTILTQHAYPPAVSALVAEAALLTGLIGQAIKLRWRFSLQVRAEGPVRLIATDYFAPEAEGAPGRMRAYARFDAAELAAAGSTPGDLLGGGVLGVTIDQGRDMAPYQGITPLTGGTLTEAAETYFAQSEQLATRFLVLSAAAQAPGGSVGWRGAGLMLQLLPEAAPGQAPDAPTGEEGLMTADDVAAMGSREDDWARVNILAATVEEHEMIGPHVTPVQVLTRLFHEERARVFAPQAVRFGCTCSAERVRAAMAMYSDKDIASMTDASGAVTADCQFCSAHYRFDPGELGFEAEARRGGG